MKISAPLSLTFLFATALPLHAFEENIGTPKNDTVAPILAGNPQSCSPGATHCGHGGTGTGESNPNAPLFQLSPGLNTIIDPNGALARGAETKIVPANPVVTTPITPSATDPHAGGGHGGGADTRTSDQSTSDQGTGDQRTSDWRNRDPRRLLFTGGPAREVVAVMEKILNRRYPDESERVAEFSGRFKTSAMAATSGEGAGLAGNVTANFARKWLQILDNDITIDAVLDNYPAGTPIPKDVLKQIDPLQDQRANLMRSDPQVNSGPLHMKYMDKDPINERLPPEERLNHDNDVVSNFPGNSSSYEMRGQTNMDLGRYAAALADASAALKANPKSVDAHLLHGAANEALGQYRDANADAKAALDIKPGDRGALTLFQATNGRANVGEGASSGLRGIAGGGAGGAGGGYSTGGAARLVPGMQGRGAMASAASLGAAERAMNLKDFRGALDHAARALDQNPNNAAAYLLRSSAFARLRDYDRAAKEAALGLKLAPGDKALLTAKALADIRRKAYLEALASANAAIEANPNDAFGYGARAHAYAGLGDREAMLADLRRAAALDARYQQTLADASNLQLPSDADILFLFPGEDAPGAAGSGAPSRKKSFGMVAAASAVGGILLALGLLQLVMAPLKDKVSSVFTKISRKGPTVGAPIATAQPASVGGMVAGVIRGQYEIGRQIGAGGMGMVFEGTDRSLGRKVAIKKMRDELRVNPRERERFVIEAKTVAALHHPNIVDIFAIAEEGEDVYLVFEYVGGRTIHDLVQHNGSVAPVQTAVIVRSVADALGYAHGKGVVHRDMKPSNVMIEADGRVKVMDFGIARMAKDAMTRYSMTNTVVGTPPYMAPEQEQGVVRKESDVYALGVCAYEMLTGKLPFIGMGAGMLMNKINMSFIPPSRAIAGLPDALDPVFEKAFQADPDNRYRTPQEFAAALEGALGGVTRRVS